MSLTRRHRHVVALFLSLAVACCLLASCSCSATPIPKRHAEQRKERAIAQQVHQVQFADESVHNTLVLLQRSMQKQKQKRQKLGKQQQQQQQQQIKKRTQSQKRQLKAAEPDNAPLVKKAADTTMTTTTTAPHDSNKNSNNKGSSHRVAAKLASGNNNNSKKNKVFSSPSAKKSQRAKLISAYEAIVFSESQIPVFLSQDHQRQQRSQTSKGKRNNKGKGKGKRQVDTASSSSSSDQPAPLSSWEEQTAADPKIHPGGMKGTPQAKEDSARDTDETGMHPKHNSGMKPASGVNFDGAAAAGKDEGIAAPTLLDALDDDKNRHNDHTMQGGEGELAQHDPDLLHTTTYNNNNNLPSSSWTMHFDRNSAFVYHGCVSSPAMLLGLFSVVLLVLYKVYTRRQRDATLSSTPSLVPGPTLLFPTDSKSTGFERTTMTRQLHMHPASTPQ